MRVEQFLVDAVDFHIAHEETPFSFPVTMHRMIAFQAADESLAP